MKRNKKYKGIFIATHYLVYGASFALRDYLKKNNIGLLVFIGHPLQIGDSKSYIQVIMNGKEVVRKDIGIRFRISLLNYILEFFLNIYYFYKYRKGVNLYIGVDPLNASAGAMIKKFMGVKELVYYTIDYVPIRYKNRLMNNIYHSFDHYSVANSTEVWNVSPRIALGREKIRGISRSKYVNQKVVPIGVWYNNVKRLPFKEINKTKVFFVGHILEKQGLQVVISAIPTITKEIPDFILQIVGGGNYLNNLKELAKELGVSNYINFEGWVRERSRLDYLMADSAIAVATYDKNLDTFTYYADPTKLKDYLSASLPVVLTDVSYNAKDIANSKCGVLVNYNSKDVANAVIKLLSNPNMLKIYRKNAREYSKSLDWSNIYDKCSILRKS